MWDIKELLKRKAENKEKTHLVKKCSDEKKQ